MVESALEVGVKEESEKIIPKDLFRKRDFIPIYGVFPSLKRFGKEAIKQIFSGDRVTGSYHFRLFSRLGALAAIGIYNLGLISGVAKLYGLVSNLSS